MIGNIRLNLWLGVVGFAFTFFASFANNIFSTTILRSLYGFLILFVLTFVLRWLLGTVVGLKRMDATSESEQLMGRAVDLMTPQENDSLQDVIRQNIGASPNGDHAGEVDPFAPLSPPKLVSTLREEDPADLANALRRLTDE